MPDLWAGEGGKDASLTGVGGIPIDLAFNIKDLGRKAMMPFAQFGKTWAVTFRFKPFPVAQRERERETE